MDEISRAVARERQADLLRAARRWQCERPTGDAPSDRSAIAAALVTVTLWGSAFVAIRDAGRFLSPGSIALGRLLVSLAVLSVAVAVRREPLPRRRDLPAIGAYGVLFLGVYSVALNAAERRVDAGTAAMLINTGPVLIAILAGFFLREGFPPWLLAGCAVAFTGCVLIGLAHRGPGSGADVGIVLLLVAAASYATAVVIQKPVLARASPLAVTWLGCVAATLACLPFAPGLVAELTGGGASAVGWTVYLGLGPTALGFATWAYALCRMSAGRLASVAYLIPVVAILLGWAVLGETPPPLAAVGGGLCLAGVLVARVSGSVRPGWRAARPAAAATPPRRSPAVRCRRPAAGPGRTGPASRS